MIRHMRHGSPPRLMALQSILSPNRRESLPTPSAGVRIKPRAFASRSLIAASRQIAAVPLRLLRCKNKLSHFGPDTVGEITIGRQKPLLRRIMVEQGRTRILFLSE